MKKLKFAPLSILAGVVLLTSCSSTSCFNPCNWRPSWKSPSDKSKCCEQGNYYDNSNFDGYNFDENSGNGNDNGGYGNDNGGYNNGGYEGSNEMGQPPVKANNAYSPYPDTSVEDVPKQYYNQAQGIDSRDTPYYNERNIQRENNGMRQKNTYQRDEEQQETPSIQKQDLDKIRSAHQRVLDRYKQRRQEETASSQDSDYFDQIVKKVISKEKQPE